MNCENMTLLEAGLNLLVALITLGLAWFIGNRLSVKWNLIQKRRETDIGNVQQFYSLYGAFKEISKIWRVIKRNTDSSLVVPSESRWMLLARACEIESKNEAIVVKLATERLLDADALETIGLFRQALQKLRESLRDNVEIPFSSRGPEYVYFNDLAAKVGLIISSSRLDATGDSEKACERLRQIAGVRLPNFEAAMMSFKQAHPEFAEEGKQNASAPGAPSGATENGSPASEIHA
jgi:hypothetical protein